jgi:hypothetical protein
MQVRIDAPQVAVPAQEGYSGQVTVYEHVDVLALHVGSDVQVGLMHVWKAAQLASLHVYEPGQVDAPW